MARMHESSRRVVVTTSLLVGGATKPSDIKNTLYVTLGERGGETRNTSWRIVSSHHLAKEHPGVLCCVFVTGPIPSSLFLSRAFSSSLSLRPRSRTCFSSYPLTLLPRSPARRRGPEVSKTRYIFLRRRRLVARCTMRMIVSFYWRDFDSLLSSSFILTSSESRNGFLY